MIISNKSPISINNDPWEAYNDILEHNQLTLSNIEFTTTNLCNMRCSHCAVGYTLQTKDPDPLPMEHCLLQVENQCFPKNQSKTSLSLYLSIPNIVVYMFK